MTFPLITKFKSDSTLRYSSVSRIPNYNAVSPNILINRLQVVFHPLS